MNDSIKLPENNYAFKNKYIDKYSDKYSDDKFTLNNSNIFGGSKYSDQQKLTEPKNKLNETIKYISTDYVPKHNPETLKSLKFCDKSIYKKYKFELDMFKLSDYEFVNWANQHTQHSDFLIMAVMAEMKKSPKMRDEIERLRPEINKIPLMPIHEYKKIRKLGDRYTSFLRQLKHEYGNHLLRILYLTST